VAASGSVGVDIGFRKRPDGSLRVAYWADSVGRKGELVLPAKHMARRKKGLELQSTRDTSFNEIRDSLVTFRENGSAPAWWMEKTQFIKMWKSPTGLHHLFEEWEKQRWDGDAAYFTLVHNWHKQDRHLQEWQTGMRRRLNRQRRDIYRVFAAKLRRASRKIYIEDIDWKTFQLNVDPESDPGLPAEAKWNQNAAAPGILASTIAQCGAEVVRVDPAYTTQACHNCGHIDNFDAASELLHRCTGCVKKWDQDHNAAINLLHGGIIQEDGTVAPAA
jgi:hypothetical protein